MTSKLAIGIGLLGLVSLGCNASTMIGDVSDGGNASLIGAGGSGTCTPPRDPNDQAFTPPTPVVGTWTGYFQGSILPVGADAIKLTIDQASDGTNQIHIVLGSTPPPAPATIATDLYPPNLNDGPWSISSRGYIDGVAYPAHEVQLFGQRLKFLISGGEAWDSWCQLQQSFKYTQNTGYVSYLCVPGGGGGSFNNPGPDGGTECFASIDSHGTTVSVDCDQFAMCSGYSFCQCDACGCAGSINPTAAFDITFDGDVATGTGGLGTGNYLRLTRATN